MHVKTIPAKIAAVIAPLALTAAIMAPTASAAAPSTPSQGPIGTPVQLQFIAAGLLFLPEIMQPCAA